jgi:predicted phage baseplate assembly protein
VIPEDASIYLADTDQPIFTPVHKLLWSPGHIDKLETRLPRGRKTDHTAINERGGTPFLPFGEKGGRSAVLALQFMCRDKAGLFGENRKDAEGAYWPIGVRVPPPVSGAASTESASESNRSPLVATFVATGEKVELKIASDTTQGFLKTGVVLLDLDNVKKSHSDFTIEFRAPSGFPRPPRVLRIEPNVIPIQQGRTIDQEIHTANGWPDFNFALDTPGLKFAAGKEPIAVDVQEGRVFKTWQRCDRLSEKGPDERAYEFDLRTDQVTFGNGVNGRMPETGSQIRVTYDVSEGEGGSVARNRKWNVKGFEGIFGVNPDPITGGAAASDFTQQRRAARARSRVEHALVSSADIEAAAVALPLLEVARAWVVEPDDSAPRTGAVTLIVMRTRPDDKEPDEPPETARWLAEIRRQLVPQIPLGTRLIVSAPHYRDFTIEAVVEAHQGLDPKTVKKAVVDELKKRLAIVGKTPRQPGVPVTKRDVAAWLRGVEGVKSVLSPQLRYANGKPTDVIKVLRSGLPRWNQSERTIEVKRAASGRSQ